MLLDTTVETKKVAPTRYLILLIIFIVTAVNYADRATLSIAGTEVARTSVKRRVDGLHLLRFRLGLPADANPRRLAAGQVRFEKSLYVQPVLLVTVYLPAGLC